MKDHTFDEVIRLDQDLYQLAMYEVTDGLIIMPKSHEELLAIEEKAAIKFNYFKKQIRNGECTYDFIKWNVLDKNGAFPKNKNIISDPSSIKNWDDEYSSMKENEKLNQKNELFGFIDELIKDSSFKDIMNFKVEPTKEPIKLPPKMTLDDVKNSRKKSKKKEE